VSVRESIINRTLVPVEIGEEAKTLIGNYRHNKEIFDSDYDLHPLYALLKIMTYVKRCALIIARKSIKSFEAGNHARENYLVYCQYREDFNVAHDEFVKHFQEDEELLTRLDDINTKLSSSIAVKYSDRVSLMLDIVDTNSPLYDVEGIEYAK
jgi:hypothetical protein